MFENIVIGWAITGSFCTIPEVYIEIEKVIKEGAKIIPIASEIVASTNTRMGESEKIIQKLEEITKEKVRKNINETEPFGPQKTLDALIILPATGNTIAKLSNGITDSSVLMAAKAHLRNNKPLIIGVSTNDGLSSNARNIGDLLNKKNIYFVPFRQDDPINKPNSLKYNKDQIIPTIESALNNKQIQPILV